MKAINFLIIAFLMSSCIKRGPITVEGILMSSCSTPAANKQGYIYQGGQINGGLWAEFITDENGYFKVVENRTNDSDFTIRVQGSSDVLKGIKKSKSIDLGKVYVNPFPANFVMKLEVHNPYTENDTLVIFDFNNPHAGPSSVKLYPGPFENIIIDTIDNYYFSKFPIQYSDVLAGRGPFFTIRHRVRSLPVFSQDPIYSDFHLAPACSGEFAEVTLVID